MDAYSYNGTAGQELVFALYGPLNCGSPYQTMSADIYDPEGQYLESVTSGNCNTGAAIGMTLTNSGTFTILVHCAAYNRTGGYSLSIQSTTGGGCNSTPITCGQTISAGTSFDSQINAYSYDGTAGQELMFALYGPLNCGSPYQTMSADIYDPEGQYLKSVVSGNCNTGAAIGMTLTNSGTFTILVHCAAYNATGSYSLSLQSVTGGGCDSTPITCGQTVSSNTSINTQMDAYSYNGTAGQELVFALYGPLNCGSPYQTMSADIYDPEGQYLESVTSGNCNTGAAIGMTLTNSGTFTILVHCAAYNRTGGYSLSIQSTTGGGCNSTPITCGQTISASTSFDSQINAYSYDGTAGQELVFALYGPLNCGSPYQTMSADIYDPEGQYLKSVVSGNCNTGAAIGMTLTNAGTYTILVHCAAYNAIGSYSLSLQSVTGGGCGGVAIPCGNTLAGQTSFPSQMNAYELIANAGEHILLTDSGFSGMAVNVYDPTGSNVVSMGAPASTNYTFAATGIYTVLVYSSSFSKYGSYGLTETVFGGCPTNPPIVTVVPPSALVPVGGEETLVAFATGSTPLEYQWRLNGTNIAGATSNTFAVTPESTNDAGSYVVVVSNPAGAVTSAPPVLLAVLDWTNPPPIVYGTPLASNVFNATATIPGSFDYSPPAGTVFDVGTNTLTLVFSPSNTTLYAAVTDTVSQVVTPAPLTITADDEMKTYGGILIFTGTEFVASGLVNGDTVTGVSLAGAGTVATATVAGSPYPIVPSAAVGTGLTNYTITYVDGSLTVVAAPLNVTAVDQSKLYGATITFGTTEFIAVGLVNSDQITGVTLGSAGAFAPATVAQYPTVPSAAVGTGLGNYSITYINGIFTVKPAPLTITPPPNLMKTYGQPYVLSTTGIDSGLVNADVVSSVNWASVGFPSTASVAGSPYTVTGSGATGAGLNNYIITYATGTITVNPAPLTVTASPEAKTYGQIISFGGGGTLFTGGGLQNGETIGFVTLSVAGNGGAASGTVGASPYTITPSAATGGTFNPANYIITYAAGNLTVSPAVLTITAANQSKTYGQSLIFAGTEFTTTGLLNSDVVTSATLTSAGAVPTAGVASSPYSVIPSAAVGAGLGNYSITYAPGALSVNPAPLTVTAIPETKTYGQTVGFAAGSTLFSTVGLQNGEKIGAVTLAVNNTGGAPTAPVSGSPYTITPSAATGGTFNPVNYSIAYASGNLMVNPAALGIIATPESKTYGQTVSFGAGSANFTASGLQNGETAASITLACSGGVATTPVSGSPYTIIPSAGTGGTFNPANYTITYDNGLLTVSPAIPVISWIEPAPVVYGTALSSNQLNATANVAGTFAYTPTNASVPYTGTNTLSAMFTPSDSSDYTDASNAVSLVVTPAALTLTASNWTKTYGQSLTFSGTEFTSTGLTNGDTVTSVVLTSAGAPASATVGSSPYTIVLGNAAGADLTNYAITYINGALTVHPASLTITANSQTNQYGAAISLRTSAFTAIGLVNSDTVSGVSLLSAGATLNAPVSGSPYSILPSNAVGTGLDNYTITYVNGTLVVTPAPLTITANNQSKPYGATLALGTTAFNSAGLLNGDTVSGVTLASPGAVQTAMVTASPYPIVPSDALGIGLANYTIVYQNGSFSITTAPLTITASNQNKSYGTAPSLGTTAFSTSGLLNSDSVTGVTLTSLGTPVAGTVAGSPYIIAPTAAVGGGLVNYTITYMDGVLTILPAPLTVTAHDQTKPYGSNFVFKGTEFTDAGLVNADTVNSVTLTSLGATASAAVAGSPYPIIPTNAVGTGLGNYTPTYVNGQMVVMRLIPNLTWTNPAAITYGNPLGSNQLDAAALVTGSFTYNPTNGTVLNAGTNTLFVIFKPDDTNNYAGASNTADVVVSRALLTVTASNFARPFGTNNPMFIGTLAGVTNGDDISAFFTCGATNTSPPGNYIILAGFSDPNDRLANYSVVTNNGTLTIISPPEPLLSFAFTITNLTFSWPTNSNGYTLQTTSNLWNPDSWVTYTGVVVSNGENQAEINTSTGNGFFRLKH
jgi:hypothetical protein